MIATLEDLDEKSLIKILQEPKNSLTKQYQELFKLDGAKLTFKENALNPAKTYSGEGCAQFLFLKGQSQPILVHSKGDNKSKSNKTTAA